MPQPPTGWPAYGIVMTISDCVAAGALTFIWDSNLGVYNHASGTIDPPDVPPGSPFDLVEFVIGVNGELDGSFNLDDEGLGFRNETVTYADGDLEGASFRLTVATRPPPPTNNRLSLGLGLGL